MPVLKINIIEGRTLEQKRALITAVTDAVCSSLGAKRETVRIMIEDMPRENYAIAGELICDRDAKI